MITCPHCHQPLPTSVDVKARPRISTEIAALDDVLGGGVALGSLVVITGDRGVGKTTLALQACGGFAREGRRAHFDCSEMTSTDALYLAGRVDVRDNDCVFIRGGGEVRDVEDIFEDVLRMSRAGLAVVDSVNCCAVSDVPADPGTPAMVEAVVNMLSSFACAEKRAVVGILHQLTEWVDGEWREKPPFTKKSAHLVDALVRLDRLDVACPDGEVVPGLEHVREFSTQGRNRLGDRTIRRLVEMTPSGFRDLSPATREALAKVM